jgi:hypothetical protein
MDTFFDREILGCLAATATLTGIGAFREAGFRLGFEVPRLQNILTEHRELIPRNIKIKPSLRMQHIELMIE